MNCVDEVEDLVIEAQKDIINHKASYDDWDNRIYEAIAQCSQLGSDVYRNDLLLKVSNHLKNVRLEGGRPKVLSLDELKTHKVPGLGPDERVKTG